MTVMLSTEPLLRGLQLEYLTFVREPNTVDLCDKTLNDFIPSDKNFNLYAHQCEALNSLNEGKNVVLRAETGSGKTESWLLYSISKRVRTLAVYPTVALQSDQTKRLREIAQMTNLSIGVISGREKTEGTVLESADIVTTNPQQLLMEIKRVRTYEYLNSPFRKFLSSVQLIVLDEFDFYGSSKASLLLELLGLLISHVIGRQIQIVVVTATLSNPEEFSNRLSELTGRECAIIQGKAPRPQITTYLILGRRGVVDELHKISRSLSSEWGDYSLDYEEFKRVFHKFVSDLKWRPSKNYQLIRRGQRISSRPYNKDDVILLLRNYERDEAVTLVFTKGVNSANELKKWLPSAGVHHHYVSEGERRRLEEDLAQGRKKVGISVRTLSQGINFPNIGRVVHYGLPQSVREYIQKNGRAGRDPKKMPVSEIVVFPLTEDDMAIMAGGINEWESLGPEVLIYTAENKYPKLLRELIEAKLGLSGSYELLKEMGLYKERLNERGEEEFYAVNFYTRGKTYENMIPVVVDGRKYTEISMKDLVEKYQPGYLDHVNDAVITSVTQKEGYTVNETSVREGLHNVPNCVAQGIQAYLQVKKSWEELTEEGVKKFAEDLLRGKIQPKVTVGFSYEKQGFTRYTEFPHSVSWIVESEGKQMIPLGDGKGVLEYRTREIELACSKVGRYEDYTYVYESDLDPRDDEESVTLGHAFVSAVLRRKFGVQHNHLRFFIQPMGLGKESKNRVVIWEYEPTALVERLRKGGISVRNEELNCSRLEDELRKINEDELVKVIMRWIDPGIRPSKMASWEKLRELGIRYLGYLCDRTVVNTKKVGVATVERKPALAISAIYLGEEAIICGFNGNYICGKEKVREAISESVLSGSLESIVHFGQSEILSKLGVTNSAILRVMGFYDVHQIYLSKLGGERPISLEKLYDEIFSEQVNRDIYKKFSDMIVKGDSNRKEVAEEVAKLKAYQIYMLYCVADLI
ncbi:hypothetical protein HS7_14090 [Sulfolobales archaeon HS-7]|nr:hypothetical protein HS7_14090 [Sulfolobales archaeon HS-7]